MRGKIFLTGASGYLGTILANDAVQSGYAVKALIRKPLSSEKRQFQIDPSVELVYGDLLSIESFKEQLQGCDYLIHTAAFVKMWAKDKSLFYKTNVEALEKLFTVAYDYKIKKIIYISSFIAIGPSDAYGTCTEENVHSPYHFHNDYEKSKYYGDEKACELIKKGIPIVRIYPGVIYGPGNLTEGNLVSKIIIDYLKGKTIGILGGDKVWSYAYIKDLTDGIIKAIEKGKVGDRYIMGGENKSLLELYSYISEVSGKKLLNRKLPYWVAYLFGFLHYWRAEFFGIEPLITHEVVNIFKHHWAYDSSKAMRELGYRITPFSEGMKITIEWIKNAIR